MGRKASSTLSANMNLTPNPLGVCACAHSRFGEVGNLESFLFPKIWVRKTRTAKGCHFLLDSLMITRQYVFSILSLCSPQSFICEGSFLWEIEAHYDLTLEYMSLWNWAFLRNNTSLWTRICENRARCRQLRGEGGKLLSLLYWPRFYLLRCCLLFAFLRSLLENIKVERCCLAFLSYLNMSLQFPSHHHGNKTSRVGHCCFCMHTSSVVLNRTVRIHIECAYRGKT